MILVVFIIIVVLIVMYVSYVLFPKPPIEDWLIYSFNPVEKTDNKTWKISFNSNKDEYYPISDFKILVKNDTKIIFKLTNLSKGLLGNCAVETNNLTVSFTDSNNDNKLSRGDLFYFKFDKMPTKGIKLDLYLIYGENLTELAHKQIIT